MCVKNKENGDARAQNRKNQTMLSNKQGAGVTQIQNFDPVTNETRTCTTKQDVEVANIGYLPELFLCGDNNHLRQPPLLEAFEYIGDTAYW